MPSLDPNPSGPRCGLDSTSSYNSRPMSRQNGNGQYHIPDNGNQSLKNGLNHYNNGNGVGDRVNQFPYNQSSHASLSQLHSHWNGNPPPTRHHVSAQVSSNSNYSKRVQQKVPQPSLINLDRTDLSISLFQYPLVSGVTMLGTGKGTVKAPDIVLHGLKIAPQHAFIERLGDEVILHPISELTSVDGRRISGPTPLQPGNLISIGDSYFFRYDGPPEPSPVFRGPHNLYEESPYAIINPRSNNPSSSAGDVNKNAFPMESPQSSSASSLTLSESQVCHPDQDRTDQSLTSFPSPRSSSASTTTSTSDPDQTSSLCTETTNGSRKYRDGLESEHFISKVARFEVLSHIHPHPHPPPPPPLFPTGHKNNNGQAYSTSTSGMAMNGKNASHPTSTSPPENLNNGHFPTNCANANNNSNSKASSSSEGIYAERKVLSKPNVNFNRSDSGYGNLFSSSSFPNDDSSISSSSVSPPDRSSSNSNFKYRRPGVTFYEDGQVTSPSPASFTEMDNDHDEDSSTSYVQSSVPSPDSLSSISNHRVLPKQNFHFHSNGSNTTNGKSNANGLVLDRRNGNNNETSSSNRSSDGTHVQPQYQFNLYNNNLREQHSSSSSSPSMNGNGNAEIACETLLQIKRKQAEETRLADEMARRQDLLQLDEILAMCEEYEEQIAKEIQDKRNLSSTSASTLSSIGGVTSPSPSSSISLHLQSRNCAESVVVDGCNNYTRQVKETMDGEIGRLGLGNGNSSDLKSPTSPTTPYNYSRIKTNGSLPRDKSSSSSAASRSNNVSFAEDEGSIFTYGCVTDKKSSTSLMNGNTNAMNMNGHYNSGLVDDVFSPSIISTPVKINYTPGLLRNGATASPYENVTTGNTNQGATHTHSTSSNLNQIHSPPRLGIRATSGMTNGRALPENININGYSHSRVSPLSVSSPDYKNPSRFQKDLSFSDCKNSGSISSGDNANSSAKLDQSQSPIPIPVTVTVTPQKSKLSVSFANSVKEFGNDESESETEETGNNSSDSFKSANNKSLTNGFLPTSNKNSIVRTISTEVEVHVESSSKSEKSASISSNGSSTEIKINNTGCSSSPHPNDNKEGNSINQPIQSLSPSTPPAIQICISKCEDEVNRERLCSSSSSQPSTNASQKVSQKEVTLGNGDCTKAENSETLGGLEHSKLFYPEDRITLLKKEVREVEAQEMEAIGEMELEKALLTGEEKSLENQLALDNEEILGLKDRLSQIDESNRRWKADGLERIAELKAKLMSSEKELQRLERMHEEFCGSTDEETVLLERLKFQHELVESDRKAFEDSEFYQMEEEINREGQRDELCKLVAEKGRKVLAMQFQLEKVISQKKISFGASSKEILTLERRRQELLQELRKSREPSQQSTDVLHIPESPEGVSGNVSDQEDSSNSDLEEKLRILCLVSSSTDDDAMHIERIKSRSPIDPHMGGMGTKTCETLRELERNREFHLNEQGVQMLEEERARVRELQKRVQDAVREEWEASRKSRNQIHSLNSVGSEESGHTTSDTPTDSGSGDDATDKSTAPSVSTTDVSLVENSGQMRQKQREMSESFEETRPLSSEQPEIGFDENGANVTRRDKSRMQIQNRPLTRYLPVRGDEDDFDLRAHIESSGHQLELCPHITVSRTAARGFLSKLGSRFHNWNKRWFVFDREKRMLVYYSDKSEKKSKARGCVHFEAIEEVYVDHLQSVKSPELTFCVKTYNRNFHLLAPSAPAMRMWIDIIFTGAEGYKEFKCGS